MKVYCLLVPPPSLHFEHRCGSTAPEMNKKYLCVKMQRDIRKGFPQSPPKTENQVHMINSSLYVKLQIRVYCDVIM